MNVADIARHAPAELRDVGVHYDTHTRVMLDAIRIWRDFGLPVDVTGDTISYAVPKPAALFYMGLFERYTGQMGFSDWSKP